MGFEATLENANMVATAIGAAFLAFLPRLVAAVVVLVLGYLIAAWACGIVKRLLKRLPHIELTLVPVIGAGVRYAILIVVLVAALSQLGVQTTSLLTILGAAGLAIGLALQGTLQNIAAGIMLLFLRPLRVNEYIEVPATAGTVEEVGLFATRLRTWDGIYKFVPNSELWNRILTNYDRNPTRLVVLDFIVAPDNDMARVRQVLVEVAAAHPKVLASPPVQAVPVALTDSSMTIQLRAWTAKDIFWATKWDLTEGGKKALAEAGIVITAAKVVQLQRDAPASPRDEHAERGAKPPAGGD